MEGDGCVLVEEAGEGGLGRGEPEPQSEELGGQLVWGAGMCRRWQMGLSLGPSVGLVAPGTQDRVSAPGLTEESCSQPAEQGAL